MPERPNDSLYALQMLRDHGDRAGQALVDVKQKALRRGDDDDARRADRALRKIAVGQSRIRTISPRRVP